MVNVLQPGWLQRNEASLCVLLRIKQSAVSSSNPSKIVPVSLRHVAREQLERLFDFNKKLMDFKI